MDELRAAKPLIAEARAAELAKVTNDLRALQTDWSDAPPDVQQLATPAPPQGVDV